jgi:hypothetical protein
MHGGDAVTTDYQRKLTRENAPCCRYCGVRLPKRLRERGVCDFCRQAKVDDPAAFWREDPMRDIPTDAVAYEQYGPYEPEPLPRLDADTIAVEREREANERRFFGHPQGSLLRRRLIERAARG